jgi:hypothetical protein
MQQINLFWTCCNKHFDTSLVPKKVIQNGVNIQNGDFTFSHQSVWALYFRHFQTYKFWILIKNYIKTNDTSGFLNKLSISSGIELELGPSRVRAKRIIQWLMAPFSFNPPFWSFEKNNLLQHTTYQIFLWYRFYTTLLFRSVNLFWKGFGQNLVFFHIIIIAHFWFFSTFFLSKLSTHFTGITWMDFVYGKMTTAYIFFTYVTKCIYYAF